MSKPRQKASKTKLRTMDQISAAAAVKLFHAAMRLGYEYTDDFGCVIPEGFPKDIAAKDFLEQLALYRQMWPEDLGSDRSIPYDEQTGEVANIAANIPEKSLEELVAQLSSPHRKVFDRIVDGSHPRLKDFVNDETLISDETGKQMPEGTIRGHVSAICKIFGVPSRKALFTKVNPLLPPKAK